MNTRPKNDSAARTRSRSRWPLMLGLSYGPTPWITAEQMQLARELTERTNESPKENRGTARGSLVRRLGEALYRGFVTAGKAHAIARGLMLY